MNLSVLDEALSQVAQRLQSSTVEIYGSGQSAGSGVIWSEQGFIVTNAHVIRGTA